MTQVPASSHGGALPVAWTVDSAGDLHIKPTSDFDGILQVFQPTGGGFQSMFNLYAEPGDRPLLGVDYQGSVSVTPDADTTAISVAAAAANTSALFQGAGHTGATVFNVADSGLLTAKGTAVSPITSGALPTAVFVSATARQLSTTRDVFLTVPFTGDATNNAATCKVEVSPDNVTFSTLNTVSIAAALNLTGAIDLSIEAWVPAGWYVKLTATHGTLGTGTYY